MKHLLFRSSLIAAVSVCGTAWAADFVVPVDMKNVGPSWTHANVGCHVSGPGLAQKSAYAKAALVNGAYKGNVNLTVVLTPAEVPLAKNWYCNLGVAYASGSSTIGPNGVQAAPGTPFKEHDNGSY